ncbi:hypothetical protein [Enterobacter phage N5822]|nr:hypothetical protein [Enterobacter phage N5822]
MRIVMARYHMPKIHLPRIHIGGDDHESRSVKHRRDSYYGDSPIAHVMEKSTTSPILGRLIWVSQMG